MRVVYSDMTWSASDVHDLIGARALAPVGMGLAAPHLYGLTLSGTRASQMTLPGFGQ